MTLELFLQGQISYFKENGFDVVAVSSPGPALERVAQRDNIEVYAIPMSRGIAPLRDARALYELRKLFRRLRPSIVHASTGKAGPLAILAATLAGVPVRVYSLRGFMIDRARAGGQTILRFMEWLTCRCAHRVIAVSRSLAELVIRERLCQPEKLVVFAHGSSNGVDAKGRFNPERLTGLAVQEFRAAWRIPERATVISFIGRLVAGKGIAELAHAWQSIRAEHETAYLVIAGTPEEHDPVDRSVLQCLSADERVTMIDSVPHTQMPALYGASDLIVLPTYSEGLPNVALEAAAMAKPVVATRVTGCVDVVEDGVTGTLVSVRDSEALEKAIALYLDDSSLQKRHGKAARELVLAKFAPEPIWEALRIEYLRLLSERGLIILNQESRERGSAVAAQGKP
jgi:glycosyltransferase involved in cell wall biosynthesis